MSNAGFLLPLFVQAGLHIYDISYSADILLVVLARTRLKEEGCCTDASSSTRQLMGLLANQVSFW